MICKHILFTTFLNEPELFFHTVKWFQVFLCITNDSIKHQSFVDTQLTDQIVLFLTIQFSISYLFAHCLISNISIRPIDRTRSGAITSGQSRLGSNGNEGVLHISQSSKTGTSLSDYLISYQRHSLAGGVLPLSAELQSMYSTAPPSAPLQLTELSIERDQIYLTVFSTDELKYQF